MDKVQFFLALLNLLFALVAMKGFRAKEKYASGEKAGCVFVVLVYVVNAIFLWR